MEHQNNDTPETYLHLWGGKRDEYRLEKLSYQPGALQLPATEHRLSREKIDEPMIIMGERGSGFKVFHDWLDPTNKHWQFYDIDTLPKDLKINFAETSTKGIFIDRTSINAKAETQELHARIVGFLDNNIGIKKLICISFFRDDFRNDPIFSNLMDHAHVYKLPSFDRADVENWVSWFCQKKGIQLIPSESLITTILQGLGGQPKLTELLFKLVSQNAPNADNLEKLTSNQIGIIKKSPPNFVAKLKTELKDMILSNPERKLLLRRYVSGNYKPENHDYHPEDINLYLAGWLGHSPKGWGIRSECHLTWAQDVLRGVK